MAVRPRFPDDGGDDEEDDAWSTDPRWNRHASQHALPRRDDVRRRGATRTSTTRVAHHPRGDRRRDQLRRHGRRLLGRRVGGDRRHGAEGTPRRGRPRDEVPRPDGPGRNDRGQLAAVDHAGDRGQPAPAGDRPHRPVPGPPPRARDGRRGDASARSPTCSVRARSAYFGSSTFHGWQIVEAQWVRERRGLARFRTEQPPYSIFARRIERDVLPVTQRYGMGVLVWSPLCRGWLTGRYRRDAFDRTRPRPCARPARRRRVMAGSSTARGRRTSGSSTSSRSCEGRRRTPASR